jgi:hypothetical protein
MSKEELELLGKKLDWHRTDQGKIWTRYEDATITFWTALCKRDAPANDERMKQLLDRTINARAELLKSIRGF